MARKRKNVRAHPLMVFWSRTEARRFSEAVERFQSLVNDLETLVSTEKRRRIVKPKPAVNEEAEVAP